MRIAIMGAGGVGGYVGGRLQAAGEDVAFVARGAHLAAMRRDGLRIESPLGDLHLPKVDATDDPSSVGTVDLVVFAVKLWDTETAARAMIPLLGPRTRVLTLQNGIDSVDLLARHVPRDRIVAGAIYLSAVIARPGVIRSPGGMHRIVLDAAGGSPVVADFRAACARATALEATPSEAVDTLIWEKFVGLAAVSGATTLLRATTGRIIGHPEARAFLRQLVEEGVAVAAATGHAIRENFTEGTMANIATMPPTFRSSMAEDLERGRPLELRWLSGRMHALGLQHGVPTPAHSATYRALVLYENGATAS